MICAAVLAAAVLVPLAAQQPAPAAAQPAPRLVVVVAVDQLATWVFERGLPHCDPDGGFQRLLRAGIRFADCAYLHGCTETGPGHATIGTGAPANAHGIVKNEWFDRQLGKRRYCVADAAAAAVPGMPEGRQRSPALLLQPTLGDLLRAASPQSKVVSVACKDRSAILMGGKSANAVVWWEASTGRFVTNATWGTEAPQWLLEFDARAVAKGFFGWEWQTIGPEPAYADCTDDQVFEKPHLSSLARTLPVQVTGGKDEPGAAFYGEAFYSPIADELVLQATLAALVGEQLGKDDVPDLLWVSFAALDTVGHYFGPESVESRDTLLRLDRLLARLLQELEQSVGEDRFAVLLTADHGVGPTPEAARAAGQDAGRGLLHQRARSAAEQALKQLFPAGAGPFVVEASEQSLYLDLEAIRKAAGGQDPAAAVAAAAAAAATAAAGTPVVQQAFVVADLLAAPPADEPIRRAMFFATHPERTGEVVLVFEPNWVEGLITATHGSPHPYDRAVPLLAMGTGLQPGTRSGAAVSPGLCAVLAAHWCGIAPPAASRDAVPNGLFAH